MVDKQTVIACIKTFNGEYSDRGFAKILTGFYVFKFIPRLKNSQYFGVFKDCDSDEILKLISELKKEGIIAENDNSKLFIVETSTKNIEKEEDNTALNEVIEYIKQNRNIFVTGGAGTGKSYILNKLKNKFKEALHITSTTGISAINVNGQTIHSWAGIGLANKSTEEVIRKIKKNNTLYKQLILCKMLAIDEISMLDDYVFEYVNEVLKGVRESSEPFGGIQVLLFGDFFQLPPVDDTRHYCFKSRTWDELNLKTIILKETKRQSEKELVDALNNVRIDKTSVNDLRVFYERDINPVEEPSRDILRIFSTNNDADTYNKKCFEEIPDRAYEYLSKDELYVYDYKEECTIYDTKDLTDKTISKADLHLLKKFNEDCKAPQTLELKEGCRVMLLKNLDIKKGLANGSCGTVKQLTSGSIDILFDNGVRSNLIPMEFEYIREGRTKIKRTQYPLRLAYGITIHKSQGMTFDKLVVNFNKIFACGQAYVALSRTRTLEGLIIQGFDHNKIAANKEVIEFYKKLENENIGGAL